MFLIKKFAKKYIELPELPDINLINKENEIMNQFFNSLSQDELNALNNFLESGETDISKLEPLELRKKFEDKTKEVQELVTNIENPTQNKSQLNINLSNGGIILIASAVSILIAIILSFNLKITRKHSPILNFN